MSLEEDIFDCFEGSTTITLERMQALIALIHKREEQWREQVSRLKIELHFSFLAREEKDEQIKELEKQIGEYLHNS